jgi:hypothetical protein
MRMRISTPLVGLEKVSGINTRGEITGLSAQLFVYIRQGFCVAYPVVTESIRCFDQRRGGTGWIEQRLVVLDEIELSPCVFEI